MNARIRSPIHTPRRTGLSMMIKRTVRPSTRYVVERAIELSKNSEAKWEGS